MAQSAGFGMDQPDGGTLKEALGQRTVGAADRQRLLVRRPPSLACCVDEQPHHRSGRDQVAPGKPGAIQQYKLLFAEASLKQELLHRSRAAFKRSALAA